MIDYRTNSNAASANPPTLLGKRHEQDTPTRPLSVPAHVDPDRFGIELNEEPIEIDAHAEDAYWAKHYHDRPYVLQGVPYAHMRAAFRFGWESRRRLPDATWAIALPRLRSEWNADPANFVMSWSEAEGAVRDAWNHAGAERSH